MIKILLVIVLIFTHYLIYKKGKIKGQIDYCCFVSGRKNAYKFKQSKKWYYAKLPKYQGTRYKNNKGVNYVCEME